MIDDDPDDPLAHHDTRARLIVDVVVFQLKLAAGSIRDLLLMPISIGAAIAGLIGGGDDPEVYFRKVRRFGRQSDLWINLFGNRRHGNTADEFVRPLEETLLAQLRCGGRLNRGAKQVNQLLDNVNQKRKNPAPPDSETQ